MSCCRKVDLSATLNRDLLMDANCTKHMSACTNGHTDTWTLILAVNTRVLYLRCHLRGKALVQPKEEL